MEPIIGKFPIEVFGHCYNEKTKECLRDWENQYCPYLQKECTKPRKSEPEIKVGICSLGYNNKDRCVPVIVCPFRFLEDNIVFNTIKKRFFNSWKSVKWVKEVNMGVSGNVDYVAAKIDDTTNEVVDFFCVEFQANGTTGSPYPYIKDLFKYGKYTTDYTFGLNWANEFMKTMMQQVYKKGNVVKTWNKKIVFVIQDVALSYLRETVDTSDLRQTEEDVIHFLTFKEVWNNELNNFTLVEDEWVSTDLEGINKILAGANAKEYLSKDDFMKNVISKGKTDGVL